MKPKWKIKNKIYDSSFTFIDWYESKGLTYIQFCDLARFNDKTVSELIDHVNEYLIDPIYYDIYPAFDLPNVHIDKKAGLPAPLHKAVDDLNILRQKDIMSLAATMKEYDFAFWKEIFHKIHVANVRIALFKHWETTGTSVDIPDGTLYVYGSDATTTDQRMLRLFKQVKLDKMFDVADRLKVCFADNVLFEGKVYSELVKDYRNAALKVKTG